MCLSRKGRLRVRDHTFASDTAFRSLFHSVHLCFLMNLHGYETCKEAVGIFWKGRGLAEC